MKLLKIDILVLLGMALIFTTSCKEEVTGNEQDLSESLDPIEEVTPVEGAENTTLTVHLNQDDEAYFDIQFDDIAENNVIGNGLNQAWCIDVWKPIDHEGGVYTGIKLYSTYRVEKWNKVNYLLNIEDELRENDEEITWREIQLAIWSLRGNPEFDLDEIAIEDLAGEMQSNGEPKFSHEKVDEVLDIVEEEYEDFDYTNDGTKFAVIAEMPEDVQTVITVVEKQ